MNEDTLGYVLIVLIILISFNIFYESDIFQLKCIVSTVDGNKYCVRERKNMEKAANLLAEVTADMHKLINYLSSKYPEQENVVALKKNFNPKRIKEILPTSEYTAYSENKGEKIAFCLSKKSKEDVDNLIDKNTLMFVALHELSHLATKTIGHDSEFWGNFKFVLQEAEELGIYTPVDYKKNEAEYCGMNINDNPYYDFNEDGHA